MRNNKGYYIKSMLTVWTLIIIYLSILIINYLFSVRNGTDGVTGILQLGGGNDSYFYWSQIVAYFENSNTILADTSLFVPFSAKLVSFLGILDPLVIRLFNYFGFMLFLIMIVKINSLISKSYCKERNYFSFLILLFYPSLLFMVTFGIYRDIWIVLFQLIVSYLYIGFMMNGKISFLIMGLMSNFILFELRSYAGMAMLMGIGLLILTKFRFNKLRLFLFILFVFSLWFTFFKEYPIPLVNRSLASVMDYRTSQIEQYAGGSTLGIRLNQPNVILFFINYFYSFVSNVFGPLFNQWNSATTMITGLIEGGPLVFLSYQVFKNQHKLTQNSIYLLILCFSWAAIFSLSNDNLGTGSRLRMFVYVSMVIVYVQILFSKKEELA